MAIIGIDLGTTNSLGSVYRNGTVELIPNAYGFYMTPSVVAVKPDNTVLVGTPAKKYQLEHPENAASLFKRYMGVKEKIRVGKKKFLPEELSSLVIASIVADAERFLGEKVEEAVISVPAYFYDEQRYATKKAGALAGIRVERIINEPSAAALANYWREHEEREVLVFDFGGGTLDVSIVDCLGDVVGIEAISGDNMLGGADFDTSIVQDFVAEHRLGKLDAQAYNALLLASEQCKIRLSYEEETELTFVFRGKTYTSHYTRKRLAHICRGILGKIRNVIERALRDADISRDAIEEIIMVGGSSKMPLVQSYIQFIFQKTPLVVDNCDEQVALGVGAFCGIKTNQEGIRQYSLADVCPFSLSTDVINHGNPERQYAHVIIPRNSMLPCSRESHLVTSRDFQRHMGIGVYQGEAVYADENVKLDELNVRIPRRKAGEEGATVRFTYDINGLLIVDVESTSGEHTSKLISRNLTDDEIERHRKELEHLKIHPKDVKENKELIARLSRYAEESTSSMRAHMEHLLKYFEAVVGEQNLWKIEKTRNEIEKALEEYDGYFNSLDDNFTDDLFLDIYGAEESSEPTVDDVNVSPDEWEEFEKWING